MSSVGRGVPYMDSWVFVTNITVGPATCSLPVNGTVQLAASVQPTNSSNPAFTWAASDTNIATVSASGWVTARGVGSTSITATTIDGAYVASSLVTVTSATSSPWLSWTRSGVSNLVFSWPPDHRGWRLLVQTNNLLSGISTNHLDWGTVPNSTNVTNISIPISTSNPSEFYRLSYP